MFHAERKVKIMFYLEKGKKISDNSKKSKSVFILSMILLIVLLVTCFPLNVFAGVGGTVSESDLYGQDTPHGHYFKYGSYVLNQWGNAPVSGTRVTTYENTGDITQAWDVRYTKTGKWIVTTNARRDLAINIYRSGANPEVNIIAYIGNDYSDCVLYTETLQLAYAVSGYTNFGVTITNEGTNPSGTYRRICRWTSTPTSFTHTL